MRETFFLDIDIAMGHALMLGNEHAQAILTQMRRLAAALPSITPEVVQEVAGDATVVTTNLSLNETALRDNETLYDPSAAPAPAAS